MNTEHYITLHEAAKILGKSRATVYRYIQEAKLDPLYKPSFPRTPYFSRRKLYGACLFLGVVRIRSILPCSKRLKTAMVDDVQFVALIGMCRGITLFLSIKEDLIHLKTSLPSVKAVISLCTMLDGASCAKPKNTARSLLLHGSSRK